MLEEQKSSHYYKKRLKFILLKLCNSPVAYVILLMLFYTLGYLSAPSTRSLPPSPKPASAATTMTVLQLESKLDNFRVTTQCADPLPPELVRGTLLDRVFKSASPYDGFPPSQVEPLLRRNAVHGWGSYGAVFERLIEKVKPKVIIEVGTFLGASALHMAELTQQLGLQTQILCIDDFRGWPAFQDRFNYIKNINGDVLLFHQFMYNVIYANASGTILPLPFSSGSALRKLCEWGVFADLIEIDAGHEFNSAWADINGAYRVLRPGGVIFGHDYFNGVDKRGVRRAVNLFAQMNGLKITTDGQHWVILSS